MLLKFGFRRIWVWGVGWGREREREREHPSTGLFRNLEPVGNIMHQLCDTCLSPPCTD